MNTEQLRIKELKAKLELAQDDLSIRTVELERVESERDALQARVKRLEEALEFGVGLNRVKELMSDNHIGDATELVKRTKEVPCPDCYGGHFKPCNICGDSGVALLVIEQKESKP